jgi:hypothetical protein
MQPQPPHEDLDQVNRGIADRRLPLTQRVLDINRAVQLIETSLRQHPQTRSRQLADQLTMLRLGANGAASDLTQLDTMRLDPASADPRLLAQRQAAEQQNMETIQGYLTVAGSTTQHDRLGIKDLQQQLSQVVHQARREAQQAAAQRAAQQAEVVEKIATFDSVLVDVTRQRLTMAPGRLELLDQVRGFDALAAETENTIRNEHGAGARNNGNLDADAEAFSHSADMDADRLARTRAVAHAAISSLQSLDSMRTSRTAFDEVRSDYAQDHEGRHQRAIDAYLTQLRFVVKIYTESQHEPVLKGVQDSFSALASRFNELAVREKAVMQTPLPPATRAPLPSAQQAMFPSGWHAVTADAAAAPIVPGAPQADPRTSQGGPRPLQAGSGPSQTGQDPRQATRPVVATAPQPAARTPVKIAPKPVRR